MNLVRKFGDICDVKHCYYKGEDGDKKDALIVSVAYEDIDRPNSGKCLSYDLIIIDKNSSGYLSWHKINDMLESDIIEFYIAGLCVCNYAEIVPYEQMDDFYEKML